MSSRRALHVALITTIVGTCSCTGRPQPQPPPNAAAQARSLFGDSTGVGLTLTADAKTGTWVVRQVWRGSPAERTGIRAGERVLALNGVTLPPSKVTLPCGSESLAMPISELRRRIQRARTGDVVRVTLERDGKQVDVAPQSAPLGPMYLDAGGGGTGTQGPVICMLCEKACPGALNNEGYWTCEIEQCGDVTTVQCKDPCLTS